MSFVSLSLHAELLRGIERLGFAEPTSIQKDAIPPALEGRDVLACSMTGSGKTAAFGLPILQRLLNRPRGATRALILTPTRELAAQIDEHLRELGTFCKVKSAPVYGGVGMYPQQQALKRGIDIIVATPGRLLDHMRMPYTKLDQVEILVLDEADRMLDMGFMPDIRRIMDRLPKTRQTLLFSATLPGPIKTLAREMLRTPANVNIERKALPATGLTQAVYAVPHHLKSSLLVALVRSGKARSVLAFTRTKHRADRLAKFLEREGIASERIHGDRTQSQRTQALEGFKRGRYRVLVATDVAARGIDVDELELVVNVDMPREPEDYIHRVGRTARAQAKGDALTFVSPDEEAGLRAIERAIGQKLNRLVLEGFDYRQASPERAPEHRGAHASSRHGASHARRGDHRHDARHDRRERTNERSHGQLWSNQAAPAPKRRFESAAPAERNENVELHERYHRAEPVQADTRPWSRPRGERPQGGAPVAPQETRENAPRGGHVPFWKRRNNKPQRRTKVPHAVNG